MIRNHTYCEEYRYNNYYEFPIFNVMNEFGFTHTALYWCDVGVVSYYDIAQPVLFIRTKCPKLYNTIAVRITYYKH